jgi:hypothetical protein
LPAGTFCQTDDDLCTDEACDGTGACITGPPVDCGPCIECHPSLGCLAPRRPVSCDESGTSSRIDIVDGASDDDDRLTWRWRKGADTSQLDAFGDPREATTYDVCVFSELLAGGESVVLRKRIAPGQTCGGEPCWRSLRRGGFAYENAGGQSSGGVERLLLRSSRRGRTRVRVDGGGTALDLRGPLTPLKNVSVDLIARDGAGERCWRARYGEPSLHTDSRYRAAQ